MKNFGLKSATKWLSLNIVAVIALGPLLTFGQTPIKLHSNKYKPEDDVKVGREAAAEAEKELQLVNDQQMSAYIARVGERLAAAIPPEFQHPEFRYSFKVVNAKEINAFALPGRPMYVNTGMIKAAKTEGEMAGVMAHEISHVALRHGTAQATKRQKYSMISNVLGVAGAVTGGALGTAAQMANQGVGVYLLKYSREYETEADLLGSRIMAAAGYDPRDLANMFQSIEKQGGGGGGWFSSHPSAKDRYAKINQEAQALKINTAATPSNQDFIAAQQRLTGAGGQSLVNNSGGNQTSLTGSPTGRVDAPSSRYQPVTKGIFSVSVPDNWKEIEGQDGLWFAPNGGYGSANNQTVFTHAVNFGAAKTNSRDVQKATDEFVQQLTQGGKLRARGGYQQLEVAGRPGLLIGFDNTNEATGKPELVHIITTQLRNGELFYMIAVSPTDEFRNYQSTFATILKSIKLSD
jgi:Peptidase family M48